MVFRVRKGDGDYRLVHIAPGDSEEGIKEAVAVRVGLGVGSFGIKNSAGSTSTFHAGLDGDWDVVMLSRQAAPGAAAGGGGGGAAAAGAGGSLGGGELASCWAAVHKLSRNVQALMAMQQPAVSPQTTALQVLDALRGGRRIKVLVDDGSGLAPILSVDEQQALKDAVAEAPRKAMAVVKFMTPHLSRLRLPNAVVVDPCASILVNSEEFPWLLDPSVAHLSLNAQKLDLFRSWAPFVELREGGEGQGSGPEYTFGKLAGYALQRNRCAIELYKASCTLREEDLGDLCTYQKYIPGECRGMLFDMTQFWLYKTIHGYPVELVKGDWTTPGSSKCVRAFYEDQEEPPLPALLRRLLNALRLTCLATDGSSYLGSGGSGHVFRVGSVDAPLALKAVLMAPNDCALACEYSHMTTAAKGGAPVVRPVVDSLTFVDGGGGYLMHDVGVPFAVKSKESCSAAFGALAALHQHGILHGDARLHNLVAVDGEPLWIDLCRSAFCNGPHFVTVARGDATMLSASLLPGSLEGLPADVLAAIGRYDHADNDSVVVLATAVWDELRA